MTQINAGRVRFVPRGGYSNSTQYYLFDLVNYNGNSYYAKENTLGNLPTDTSKWQLIAEKGDIGPIGPTGETGNGIESIEKTSTSGYVDKYTITFTDGTTTIFEVTNGEVSQAELDEVKEENDYLNSIINQLPKVSSQGTILTLNNTINGRMNIELGTSELEQETTTGKNKYVGNDINTNGTYSASESILLGTQHFEVGTYTISLTNELINGSYLYIGAGGSIATSIVKKATFTISTEGDYNIRYVRTAGTYNNFVSKIQIEEGSSDTSYEQYTGGIPAPNPSYPMPIHTISGNNKVVIEGSNLFVDNNLQSGTWGSTNGAYYPYGSRACTINKIKVVPNQKYVISNNNTSTYSFRNIVDGYQKDGTFVQRLTGTNGDVNGTVLTMPSNVEYINVTFNETSDTVTWSIIQSYLANGTLKPQMNKGETLLPYTPYVSQEANINLGDIEYCEIGDYKDEFVRDNEGNWGIRKNIGKDKLTSDNVIYHGVDNYRYQYELIPSQNTIKNETILSNYFYDYGNTNWWTYDGNIIIQNATVIYMTTTKYTSITAFNNFTSANDVYVYYPLATPTYTPITGTLAEQLENIYQYLLSYKGQTNISQENNDLPFVFSASALLDLNTLVGE